MNKKFVIACFILLAGMLYAMPVSATEGTTYTYSDDTGTGGTYSYSTQKIQTL